MDDIPRWASLLNPEDQNLFSEIASCLWGVPALFIHLEGTDDFDRTRTLVLLQHLVEKLVSVSGLFDRGSEGAFGSYRLHMLRQRHASSIVNGDHACEQRRSLDKWRPVSTPEVQGTLESDEPKPPDPEERHFSILARITVIMAGAIFGAIFLYLCCRYSSSPTNSARTNRVAVFRHGSEALCQPVLVPGASQDLASDQIITRNSAILAMYIGYTSFFDSGSWTTICHFTPRSNSSSPAMPGAPPGDTTQAHSATDNMQSSYKGHGMTVESIG